MCRPTWDCRGENFPSTGFCFKYQFLNLDGIHTLFLKEVVEVDILHSILVYVLFIYLFISSQLEQWMSFKFVTYDLSTLVKYSHFKSQVPLKWILRCAHLLRKSSKYKKIIRNLLIHFCTKIIQVREHLNFFPWTVRMIPLKLDLAI